MNTSNSKSLSPFGQAAMDLDHDFTELEQLSGQLERLVLDSDSGLERAKKILSQFGECGERVGDRIQRLAKTLDEARLRAEGAAQRVAARAAEIQERQELSNRLVERFDGLNAEVGKVKGRLLELKTPGGEKLTAEQVDSVSRELSEVDAELGTLIDAARGLQDEASHAGLRTIERNADSLSQALISARGKLGAFIPEQDVLRNSRR